MKKSEFAEKYNVNLEDAQRDLEAKLDKRLSRRACMT